MGDPLKRYNPGDQWIPDSRLFNWIIDTIRDYQSRTGILGTNALSIEDREPLYVKNGSGSGLAQYSVVGIGSPVNTPGEDLTNWRSVTVLASAPPAPGEPFAVLQEPTINAGLAKAQLSGTTKCLVNLTDLDHEYADAGSGVYTNLVSQAGAGPAQILWTEPAASTTLVGNIVSNAALIIVASSTGFPALPFVVTINSEEIQVTAISASQWTVTRGYNSTTAADHTSGATISFSGTGVVWALIRFGFEPTSSGITSINAETGTAITFEPGVYTTVNVPVTDEIVIDCIVASATQGGVVTDGTATSAVQQFSGPKLFVNQVYFSNAEMDTASPKPLVITASAPGTSGDATITIGASGQSAAGYAGIVQAQDNHSSNVPSLALQFDAVTGCLYLVSNASSSIPAAVYGISTGGGTYYQGVYGTDYAGNTVKGGIITALGSGPISVANGGTGLVSLTAHDLLIGNGTSAVSLLAPSATSGVALISQGASSNPAYGTVVVAGGGTGLTTVTSHNLMIGAGTSAITLLAPSSTSGIPLISQGSSADPTYGIVVVAGGGTGLASLTAHNLLIGSGTSHVTLLAPSSTSGVPLISQGSSSDPAYGTVVVAGGGTGLTSATAYAVLCGGTSSTGALQSVASVGTSGQVLTSNGASALPTFQTFSIGTVAVGSGGTGKTSLTTYAVLCGGTTSTGALQQVSGVGTSGQVLVSNGASALPTWQSLTATISIGSPITSGGAYYTLAVDGSGNLTQIAPSSTTGFVLTSNGSGSLPSFQASSASMAIGGIVNSATSYNVLSVDGSGDLSEVSPTSNSGYVLTSNGLSSAPTFQAVAGGMAIGNVITGASPYQALVVDVSGQLAQVSVGTAGYVLTSNGSALPTFQAPQVGSSGIDFANVTPAIVSGSTSGVAYFSMPFQSAYAYAYKKVVIFCLALLGTASWTFPQAFNQTPVAGLSQIFVNARTGVAGVRNRRKRGLLIYLVL